MLMAKLVVAASAFAVTSGLRRQSKRMACGIKGKGSSLSEISHMINGEDAAQCEWPWQATIWGHVVIDETRDEPFQKCGGVLIHPDWVLTVAHCLGDGPWDLEVSFGEVSHKAPRTPEYQRQRVVEIYKHPNASAVDQRKHSDLALVRLENPVKVSDCVRPVCLPTEDSDEIAPDTKCWVTGFGSTANWRERNGTMREGEVSVVDRAECTEAWKDKGCSGRDCQNPYRWHEVDDTMVCALGTTKDTNGAVADACQGDDGAPLVSESDGRWTLHGVRTWGEPCTTRSSKPGLYAKVQGGMLEWIRSTMQYAPVDKQPIRYCPESAKWKYPASWGSCECAKPTNYCYNKGERCNFSDNPYFAQHWFNISCETCECSATPYPSDA